MKFSRILIQCIPLMMLCGYGFATRAQGTEQLDSMNNISVFKFDADTTGIKHLLANKSSSFSYKDLTVYDYLGESLKTYFDVPVTGVRVYYYENKLYRVDLSFGKTDKEYTVQEFNKIQNLLQSYYGETVRKLLMTTANVLGGGRWEGEKMMIDHTRHSFAPKRKQDNSIYGEVTFVKLLKTDPMSPLNAIK